MMITDSVISIEPIPISNHIVRVNIRIDDFKLNANDCRASVLEYDENNKLVNIKHVYVPPEIYIEWGTDDNYLINYVLEQSGHRRNTTETQPI